MNKEMLMLLRKALEENISFPLACYHAGKTKDEIDIMLATILGCTNRTIYQLQQDMKDG